MDINGRVILWEISLRRKMEKKNIERFQASGNRPEQKKRRKVPALTSFVQ